MSSLFSLFLPVIKESSISIEYICLLQYLFDYNTMPSPQGVKLQFDKGVWVWHNIYIRDTKYSKMIYKERFVGCFIYHFTLLCMNFCEKNMFELSIVLL